MVLDFILEKLHKKRKLNKDSQSSAGLLTLGWEAAQHKSTAKEVISKLNLIKGKGIDVEIKWTPGHAEIKGNEEADRLAEEESKADELMSDEGMCISRPELKQAAKTHGLTVWQRQWDISDKGRFLHQLKPKVTAKTLFEVPEQKIVQSNCTTLDRICQVK